MPENEARVNDHRLMIAPTLKEAKGLCFTRSHTTVEVSSKSLIQLLLTRGFNVGEDAFITLPDGTDLTEDSGPIQVRWTTEIQTAPLSGASLEDLISVAGYLLLQQEKTAELAVSSGEVLILGKEEAPFFSQTRGRDASA